MITISRMLLVVLLLSAAGVFAEDSTVPPPDVLVQQVVDDILASIRQNRELTHDPGKMDGLVDAKILPHFDFFRMTRLTVGGRYWADATPQEQRQLVDEYRTFLAHTFANVIAQYTNQTIFFAPLHMRPDDREVTVRTTVIDPADEPTELDYRMERTASGWMVYDVDVDYIWLTRIYRSNFDNELRRGGVRDLVRALHQKNHEVAVARNSQGAGLP